MNDSFSDISLTFNSTLLGELISRYSIYKRFYKVQKFVVDIVTVNGIDFDKVVSLACLFLVV